MKPVLKPLLLALLAANALFFAWSHGALDPMLGVQRSDREPERLKQQVRPESIRIVSAGEAAAAASAAAAPRPVCLQAGPFAPPAATAAQTAAAATLPEGSWEAVPVERAGRWMLFIGRYANAEALQRRQEDLTRRHIAAEPVQDLPAYMPGLSLGRFDDHAKADEAAAALRQQGLQNVRVVELERAATWTLLRVPKADAALATSLTRLKVPVFGEGFVSCPTGG